jgi:flagellar hook-associated protein 2
MAISSQGIGSGLDVNSIVTQLVAIEKQPLKVLQTGATKLQSQVSIYGAIKSQIATLQDAATTLAKDSSWAVQSATSSNVAAATVSVDSTASSVDLNLEITQLAQAQTVAAQAIDAGAKLGLGTGVGKLTLQLGSWGSDGTGSFVAASSAAVSVDVNESDTYATIATAINAKNAGIKAIVLTSGGKDRLSLQSTSTGSDTGFAVTSDGGFAALEGLAYAPVTASQSIPAGTSLGSGGGAGVLTITAGSRAAGGSFVAGAVPGIPVNVNESDTFADIAAAINAASGGLFKATVLTSGGSDRIYLQATPLGSDTEFSVSGDVGFAAFTPAFTPTFGPVSPTGMSSSQMGLNAAVKVNGVSLSPPSNTMTNVVPGVTLSLLQKSATSQISVVQDKPGIQTSIQAFADAYTAISKTLADATRYVPGGQSGALQGDTTTVGLQRLMRQLIGSTTSGSGSAFTNLSKVGLELQTDGSLKLNATSLKTAMGDMTGLQTLFTFVADPGKTIYNKQTDGFGVKLRELAKELLNTSGGSTSVNKDNGFVTNKAAAIQASITRNADEQDRVNTRAAAVEKRLRAQYSALDAKMATMSSLSSYVTAQLAQWNKTTN